MRLKGVVAISLLAFAVSVGLILLIGLWVLPPSPTAVVTDPVTGQTEQVSGGTSAGTVLNPADGKTGTGGSVAAAGGGQGATPGGGGTPGTASKTPVPGSHTPTPTTGPTSTPGPGHTPTPTPAPTPTPVVHCGGRTPCYGPSTLAGHTSSGSCWGYNIDVVYNLTAFAPAHPDGPSEVNAPQTCGKNVAPVLAGQTAVAGNTHNHSSSVKNNTDALLLSYKVGYYDPNQP